MNRDDLAGTQGWRERIVQESAAKDQFSTAPKTLIAARILVGASVVISAVRVRRLRGDRPDGTCFLPVASAKTGHRAGRASVVDRKQIVGIKGQGQAERDGEAQCLACSAVVSDLSFACDSSGG